MKKIYEFLNELYPEHDFISNEGVIEDGVLDSFDIISLVTMIEEEYDVIIDALAIVPENFISVESIANVIRKHGGAI
ncbi:acyl carrier protein [Paenibacillus thiaminolyticus]|uniref:Acyl carrier protein n=1 Tax=Paenibacillus thiaminolyticus TaxID=49283 RepID=A0AAP9J2F6_PANTH|nr:acyl carrier protein [Paenibacillus thiaminolyticus]MCY9534069.1 acyl carrier protein [Paenibacillus thiaminolyticus]MCY9600099.1 acyl carrier protein [Paenibacillus thiaminolyticus]MCY9608465.1 acyl carrier protein [Paenibacillus thiaminolyticus]MCY9615244.1 acyl carrier protein [Paenibacillus thiaminolyticus]MCY9620549.1 acyl carrier protein [Paenibacillus thiaminolyticus]